MPRHLLRLVARLAALAMIVPGLAAAASAMVPDASWDRAGCAEAIVLGRILDVHTNAFASGTCIIDPRVFYRLEILEVLQGSMHPKVVEGWFVSDRSAPRLWGDSHRFDGAVGKLAVLFPESVEFRTLMRSDPDLPGGGVLVLKGLEDPALARIRLAIRRASLDSLLARAEAVVFGGYRRGQSTEFVVRRWLSDGEPRETLHIWHAEGWTAETGKVLLFLERDAGGRWQPAGDGAGELAVRGGRVVRYGRKLDDVLREICMRRPCATAVTSLQ